MVPLQVSNAILSHPYQLQPLKKVKRKCQKFKNPNSVLRRSCNSLLMDFD